MSSVKDSYLSLFVRCNFRNNVYIKSCLFERKLFLKPFRTFYIPYSEYFADIEKHIRVSVLFFESLNFLFVTDPSGNDPVYQCRAEEAVIFKPSGKVFTKAPVSRMLLAALKEFFTVIVDQLTGKDHESFSSGLESLMEKYGELCREGCRRKVVCLAARIIYDSGFCCI